MSNLIRPSLVVFDLDGTLYDYDEANAIASSTLLREFSQSAGVSKDAISDAMSRARMNVKNRLGSTAASHSRLLYISEAYRLLKLHPDTGQLIALEEIFWKTFLDNIKLFGNVEALLSILKKDCIPLALITDLTSNIQYKKINVLGLNSFFDVIVTSEEAGGDKVSALPFSLLGELHGKIPLNSWFIGDSDFDRPQLIESNSVFFKKVSVMTGLSSEFSIEFIDYEEIINKLR